MPKKEDEKTIPDFLSSDAEEGKKTRLEYLKELMTNAGYGAELKKYKDNGWLRAACELGVLRDGFGNRIDLPKDASPERVADTITAQNGSFYIAERETGAFRKFGGDGADGFMSMPYNTPPEISRPNFFVRLLDYLGFDIPSVKEYNKQMESVKGNPLYIKLNTATSLSASRDFLVKSSRLPDPVPEKEEPVKEPEKEEAVEGPAEEVVPEKAEEIVAKSEPALKEAEPVNAPVEESKAVSVEETDGEIRITMADGSVKVFAKQAPEKTAPEKTEDETVVLSEADAEKKEAEEIQLAVDASLKEKEAEADALSDIDLKIFELGEKAKNYPESSPIGIEIIRAQEALETVKRLGVPEDPASPSYSKQFDAAADAVKKLFAVDFMEYTIETGSKEEAYKYSRGSEASSEIVREAENFVPDKALWGALAEKPAEKFNSVLTSETALLRFEKSVLSEAQRIEKEEEELRLAEEASLKEKEQQDNSLSDIDAKLFELNKRAEQYPESSPIGIAILRAKNALEDVRGLGVPVGENAQMSAEQLSAVQRATKNLLVVDSMEYYMRTQPADVWRKYALGSMESTRIADAEASLIADEAVNEALGADPAKKFSAILSSPSALGHFENEVGNAMRRLDEAKNAVEEAPEKAAATDEPDAAEKAANEPSAQKKADPRDVELIDKKLYELSQKAKQYPEDSPMGVVFGNARESLEELKKTGLPGDEAEPDHELRMNAAQKAAAGLLFADQLEEAVKNMSGKERDALVAPDKHPERIIGELEKLTSSAAVERTLYKNTADKMRRILSDGKELGRFEKAVVREMKNNPNGNLIPKGAVPYGAVYKLPGKPGWQRVPGASEADVKKSLDELSAMPPDSRIFRRIAKAESEIPVLRKKEDPALKERIGELRRMTAKYPEGSVMKLLGEKAAGELAALEKTGLPQDPASPAYKKQQEALKKAVGAVCAFEHFEKKAQKLGLDGVDYPDPAHAAEEINAHYVGNALIGVMAATEAQKLSDRLLHDSIEGRGLAGAMRKEERERRDNGIPLSAERKGALYRMNPRESWKQVPGATLKEINDSVLTVMDEKQTELLVSRQKAKENVHISDSSIVFGN